MYKNLYEVFDEFQLASKKEDKINVLRKNYSKALESVLRGAFHPKIKYVVDKIPEYKTLDAPPGLGYSSIAQELDRIYILEENHPRVAPNLTLERKKQILVQMLEVLEDREAQVFAGMIMKKLPVKGLTYKIVNEAFPNLLPEEK